MTASMRAACRRRQSLATACLFTFLSCSTFAAQPSGAAQSHDPSESVRLALAPTTKSDALRRSARTPAGLSSALRDLLKGGKVEISLYSQEFVNWQSELSYYDTPQITVSGRWRQVELQPTSATWELYKKANNASGRITLASGALASLPNDPQDVVQFKVNLPAALPLHNDGSQAQEYFVSVFSKTSPSGKSIESRRTKLIHLPKGQEAIPQPANPYTSCSSGVGRDRRVRLEIPQLYVESTTSTSGDGDRDELYILRGRKGPGTYEGALPRLPAADDYYEAKNGKTLRNGPSGSPSNIIPWTNQDEQFEAHPVLLNIVLKHGETVTIESNLSEQDNEELDDIRTGLITAFTGVAAVASAVGGYGYVVAGAATAGAGAAALIPQTAFHDFVGSVSVTFTNECGYIKSAFVAPKSIEFEESGTATINFVDVQTHEAFNDRRVVLSAQDQFWPNGVDWGDFQPSGAVEEFFLEMHGTSESEYSAVLRATVELAN